MVLTQTLKHNNIMLEFYILDENCQIELGQRKEARPF